MSLPISSNSAGLTEQMARKYLARDGFNELPAQRARGGWKILLDVLREPMFILLLAAGAIYLALGSLSEALILVVFVTVIIWITYYQERKTERALSALQELSAPQATVVRSGREQRISSRNLVRGDLILVKEGDRIPADAEILVSENLSVDESLLTGESQPVVKGGDLPAGRPDGINPGSVYSGTLVVTGQAQALVQQTGVATQIGKIGQAVKRIKPEEAPVQRETKRIVTWFALVGLGFCTVFILVYWLTRGDFLGALLGGIAMSMAVLPEEFPVVLTVFLALGAWRLSKKHVLTRRIPAIESLGEVTTLAVDKTGTITQNRMAVTKLWVNGKLFHNPPDQRELPEAFHRLAEFAVLAGQARPYDPMEKALQEFGKKFLIRTEHWHDGAHLVKEYPLSRELLSISHVWQSSRDQKYLIAAKGAPEAIVDLCHLAPDCRRQVLAIATSMAKEGLRILGVAQSAFSKPNLPIHQHDLPFDFLGLVGLADPVRPGVARAVRECYRAGLRVIMITGDYPQTAQNIAQQIGLRRPERVITGAELQAGSVAVLRRRITEVNIFARVWPEQKLKIVSALKASGEIVAMTGDGVNDAPALKAAHVGIAMGKRGTDVARESAGIVLLDDNFNSIVGGVRQGRKIFDNLKKAMAFILSVHIPIIAVSLVPVLFGWPLILFPLHIAFLELVIDPACSLVFEAEPEEAGLMSRPPRDRGRPLFGRTVAGISFFQGLGLALLVLAVFFVTRAVDFPEGVTRAMAFATLIFGNLAMIMTNRSWSHTALDSWRRPNRFLWWVITVAVICLALVLYVPWLQRLFYFEPLSLWDILICIGVGLASIIWFEILKSLRPKQLISA